MVKKAIEQNFDAKDYNAITNYNEHQNFWNRAMGRYSEYTFPLKDINTGKHINNKDQLAINDADKVLLEAWKNRNQKLKEDIGEQWFNRQDPALGTIGVFSKFFGLDYRITKSVDELFPGGFDI